MVLCPFNCGRAADTSDHVFPRFLGGRRTILACKQCNNTFGHTFEGAASKHFKDWMFVFRRCGMATPGPMVWPSMALDDSGRSYDIDQDFQTRWSNPEITRDERGRVESVAGDLDQVGPILKSLQEKGHEIKLVAGHTSRISLRGVGLSFRVDDDIKRLCLKMAVGASYAVNSPVALDHASDRYLREATVLGTCPVRLALERYADLDRIRPAVGHLVYVQADRKTRYVYAVVQFFSAVQLYCELSHSWSGADLSFIATHDPISHLESFGQAPPLHYPLPPESVSPQLYETAWAGRLERLREELVDLYGDQAPLRIAAD